MRYRMGVLVLMVAGAGCGETPDQSNGPSVPEYVMVFSPPTQGTFVITPGSSGTVEATIQDRHGHVVVPDQGPTFHSANPSILAVDATGHYTAVGIGSTQILAEARVGSTEVNGVLPVVFACTLELTVHMAPAVMTLDVGQRFTPVMTLTSCGGWVTVPATITWSTTNTGVLAVNPETGETTALQSGTGTVTGTAGSIAAGLTGSVAVTVR